MASMVAGKESKPTCATELCSEKWVLDNNPLAKVVSAVLHLHTSQAPAHIEISTILYLTASVGVLGACKALYFKTVPRGRHR